MILVITAEFTEDCGINKSSKRESRLFNRLPGSALMNVSYRPMQLKDVPKCVEHVAVHPILGPRYGKLIEQLPSAIRFALLNGLLTTIFEECRGSTTRHLGATMGFFVSDAFLHQSKTAPSFWLGPELVKRIAAGKSPILSSAQVRDANSAAGLNLLVWHNTCHPQDLMRGEIATAGMTSFDQISRGFRLQEVVAQADCLEHMNAMRYAGGLYFDRVLGTYGNSPEVNAWNFSDEPRNFGITRDLAFTQGSSWLSSLFVSYSSPRLGLSQGEQRLLLAARDGATDEELSGRLGISIHAVKMRWRMIYDRAAACLPDLVADNSCVDGETRHRGREKKQHFLDYIRRHPEELRPISRKLLNQWTAQKNGAPYWS